MTIERHQVQDLARLKPLKASTRTVDRTPGREQVDPGQDVGGILNTFVQAAGSTMKAVGTHLQTKIEEDKIRQMNNAFLGLQPSDDATKAGYRAHAIVGMQNNVLADTSRLRAEAEAFEGTDEEWASKVVASRTAAQDAVNAKYPALEGDADSLAIMTNLYNEQAPQLTAARVAGKMKQEQVKREGEFQDAILMRSDSLEGAELKDSIDATMGTMRETLGLTKTAAERMLVQAAMNASSEGNSRLLEYTKTYTGDQETTLYQRSGKLQAQNEKAEKIQVMQDQAGIANAKGIILESYYSGSMTKDEFHAAVNAHNATTKGVAWSVSQIQAAEQKRQKALVDQTDSGALLDQMDGAMREGGNPLAITEGDKGARSAGVTAAVERSEGWVEQALNNLPPEQITPEIKRALEKRADLELSDLLMSNGLTNPEWTEKFKSLVTLPFEASDDINTLPDNVTDILDIWYNLPEPSRAAHVDDAKTAAFMANLEGGLRLGLTGPQSLDKAQRAARFTRTISAAERTKIEEASADATDSIANSWWPWVTDTPEWFASKIGHEILEGVTTSIKAGHMSPEQAAKEAQANFENNYTRLDNGQLMFGSRQSLAKRMKVHPDDIEGTLDAYLEMNKTALEDQAFGSDTEHMYFDVIPHRGTVVVRSMHGDPLTAPMPLDNLREGTDVFIREKAERARTMGTFDVGFGAPMRGDESAGKAVSPSQQPEVLTKGSNQEYDLVNGFTDAVASVENSVRLGRDATTGAWHPHESLEGGNTTLAYGHKLTSAEISRGYVALSNGKQYKFQQGESQITDRTAKLLLGDDLAGARALVKKKWKGFSELPLKYQKVLEGIEYNVGMDAANWPKLRTAMQAGDDTEVRKQMITSYKPDGSDAFIPLKERAEQLADALGLEK